MKKQKVILFTIILLLCFIVVSIITNQNRNIKKESITIKEMSESTQVSDLQTQINQLNASHTEYMNYIQISKKKISNAINLYPNNNVSETASFSDFITHIENLTTIPSNTYYYVLGTEGSNSIERYKKINDAYYICDENGRVENNSIAIDLSNKTLISYLPTTTANLSAGSASFVDKNIVLGDGTDNTFNREQGSTDVTSGEAVLIAMKNGINSPGAIDKRVYFYNLDFTNIKTATFTLITRDSYNNILFATTEKELLRLQISTSKTLTIDFTESKLNDEIYKDKINFSPYNYDYTIYCSSYEKL